MAVELNHTIVWARDNQVSAMFMAEILGLPAPIRFGPFMEVKTGNGVDLAFHSIDGDIASQHYAFLVSEAEFDEIFRRILERGLPYWADPLRSEPGKINHADGGRGVYFHDPDGHLLEVITRPYGSGDEAPN
jgi:catechol 2,3-dioxygenase-like lactoylglutathione lyase family enzyme